MDIPSQHPFEIDGNLTSQSYACNPFVAAGNQFTKLSSPLGPAMYCSMPGFIEQESHKGASLLSNMTESLYYPTRMLAWDQAQVAGNVFRTGEPLLPRADRQDESQSGQRAYT